MCNNLIMKISLYEILKNVVLQVRNLLLFFFNGREVFNFKKPIYELNYFNIKF